MGYHVTIGRKGHKGNKSIPLEEFWAACNRLGAREFADGGRTAQFLKCSAATLSVFWNDGKIWSSNPDQEGIKILHRLSEELGGRLVGDGLETYKEDGTSFISQEDMEDHVRWKRECEKVRMSRRIGATLRLILLSAVLVLIFLNKCSIVR